MATISEEKALEWLLKFKQPINNIFKGIKSEIVNAFDIGLSKYIYDREKKLSKINTFISRDKKVDFYKVYFSQTISSKTSKNFNSNKVLQNLFNESNVAAIIATAGSGKTMLMKHIFLSSKNELFKIPLFIELRDFNNKEFNFFDYLYTYILSNKIKPSEKIFERALASGSFLFLFDGYDELSHAKKVIILEQVQTFIDLYPKNHFIFSSRPGTGIEYAPRITKFSISDLSFNQINEFIDKQAFLIGDKKLIEKLKVQMQTLRNSSYSQYLKNPLLLSMFILTFKDYPELPKTKSKFYFNVFDTLTVKHNSVSKREGFVHPRKTNLNFEEFDKVLQAFSFISILENEFNFSRQYLKNKFQEVKNLTSLKYDIDNLIYDLQVCIAILTEDGDLYSFPHRTMQDYFACQYIKSLDPETKHLVYNEYFVENQHLYSNTSLLGLCIELDNAVFTQSYTLPVIGSIKKIFSKTSFENVITFLDNFAPSLILNLFKQGRILSIEIEVGGWSFDNPISALTYIYAHDGFGPFDKIGLNTMKCTKNSSTYKYFSDTFLGDGITERLFLSDKFFYRIPSNIAKQLITRSGLLADITYYIDHLKTMEDFIQTKYNSSKNKVSNLLAMISKDKKKI